MRTLRVLGLLGLAACNGGSGSDIGPKLSIPPEIDYRVLVRDDLGRAVCNARVTVDGFGSAVTNRAGRAEIPGRPAGTRVVRVDASSASATATDRLTGIAVSAAMPDGDALPYVLFVPDVAPSVGLTLPTGTLPGAVTLDDSATSGAIVAFASGTAVGHGTASSVELRSGKLALGHIPVLPVAAGGTRLAGRAVVVDPADTTFAPGGSLSMPNDLGLPALDLARLFWLDPATGSWTDVGSGQVDGSGARIVAAAGAVTRGGLYTYAASTVAAPTTVVGRILDQAGEPAADVLLLAGEAKARSGADGRFVLGPISATNGSGGVRALDLECFGGRDRRPQRTAKSLGLVSGTVDAGDIRMEIPLTSRLRALLINRGLRVPNQRLRMSSLEGLSYGVAVTDALGEATFPEQESGISGAITTVPQDEDRVFLTEASVFANENQRTVNLRLFGRELDYWLGRGKGTVTYAVDQTGTGVVRRVAIIRGQTPGEGFVAETSESGYVNTDYGFVGEITGTIATGSDGRTVICASSFVDPDSGRAELPIERALRQPIGAFDPHGLLSGSLTGGGSGPKSRRVLATRRLGVDDWYDQAFFGNGEFGSTPMKVDPALTGTTPFLVGLPLPLGHVAAAEGTTAAGVFTLERIGFLSSVATPAGGQLQRDIPLSLPATTTYTAANALANLDPRLTASDFRFDLGVELGDYSVLQLVAGVGGNMSATGSDVAFLLPDLAPAQARRWLLAFQGTQTAAGKTVSQKSYHPLSSTTGSPTTLLAVPDIVAPAPGATVPANGFTVQYTVPPGTTYIQVQLRAVTGSELRVWNVVVHPDYLSYAFRLLPPQFLQVLKANVTWTLTVTAARIGQGPISLSTDPYRRALTHWVGLSAAQRTVDAMSSTSITVTTQ